MNLFEDEAGPKKTEANTPLAARMRPRTLDEFVGQEQILGPDTLLRRAIEDDALTSVIFYGPPGVGKSTLAHIIAGTTKAHFEPFSAVTGGLPELRKLIEAAATRRRLYGTKTVLFIDEIHRFNKAQQDALLPHVENGFFVQNAATTENPYFEVNAPLLSRARVFTFGPLSDEDMGRLLDRAASDPERGLGALNVALEPEARAHLIEKSGGDARTALNALELAATTTRPESRQADAARRITRAIAEEALQRRALIYDKTGDNHYDTISAFIKSIRGSDPDAGLYYLATMLTAGEDARFIARRLVILASEDIGNADPMALVIANAAAHAVEYVGLPEAQLNLAQAVTYLAAAPKSNASYVGLKRALADVQEARARPVPKHLRDTRSATGRRAAGDAAYLYPHDYPGGYVAQSYLPAGVQTQPYYEPTEHGAEAEIKRRMEERGTPPPPILGE
ncbi:MAG: replication-associated recombination protein A [Armatimonadetes bacterium]|nr:replication-associated recombination protein A [Armatimonadota bacterium]